MFAEELVFLSDYVPTPKRWKATMTSDEYIIEKKKYLYDTTDCNGHCHWLWMN